MARPKGRQLSNRVSVALTEQQLIALENLALKSQAAISWVIRCAVAEYIERHSPGTLRSESLVFAESEEK